MKTFCVICDSPQGLFGIANITHYDRENYEGLTPGEDVEWEDIVSQDDVEVVSQFTCSWKAQDGLFAFTSRSYQFEEREEAQAFANVLNGESLNSCEITYADGKYPHSGWEVLEVRPEGQSAKQSFVEAMSNTFAGFILAMIAHRYIILPTTFEYGNTEDSWWTVAALTSIFYSILSVARNYAIRRIYNNLRFWKLLWKKAVKIFKRHVPLQHS